MSKSRVDWIKFVSWRDSVPVLLQNCALKDSIRKSGFSGILLKPNLVEASPPPITTPVELIVEIVEWIRAEFPNMKIVIAEGCGSTKYDTKFPFEELGYAEFANRSGIQIIDLNYEKTVNRKIHGCTRWPEMRLPSIIYQNFLLSVPVLKAHSLADVTLTMKNMLGCAPPSHYCSGTWKKSSFHEEIHQAIYEMNLYRKPDFTILDATVGMSEAHLWGPHCDPPVGKLIASDDPVGLDAFGAELLGLDWNKIDYIRFADGRIGEAKAERKEILY
ncbi:MAG TPA: DUF362 domain-containing protein [Victivallales bacterium]|nr:DUF362 domain-containing protein [Victivallales bacterium]